LKVVSAALVGAGLFALPALAQAQEVTLRVEPGVAVPLTDPQAQRFDIGGAIAIKPEIGLGSYLSVGPSLSYMALPSKLSGVDTGTALGLGGFARLKRPHDYQHNPGTGFKAVSPWIDGDAGYVRTDPLDRFFWSAAVGASVPTSDSRWLWVGPFARFTDIHEAFDKANTNTNNSKTMILGLSFELGAAHKRPEPAAPPPPPAQPAPPPVQPPPVVPPPVVLQDVDIEARAVVQFAWDSPVLDSTATAQLDEVLKKLTSSKSFKAIRVEGHASSEGQVKHNDVLAQNRANSVIDYLAAHGVPREKLSAVGFGSRNPVASNKTEAGRVLNRRAEFVVNFVIVKEVK
jgi:outer membrane protein OmpA-like peptidoglycan-associated protein